MLFKTLLCGPVGAGALLISGIIITFRLRFIQVRKFPMALRNLFVKPSDCRTDGALSPMQTLCTALAGTMGTGNIAGVAGAIALGGPGAVVWMWIAAFFSMATKYAEICLSVRYREKDGRGGPMYYISRGLGKRFRPLAAAFCICGVLSSFGVGNATQVNALMDSLCALSRAAGWRVEIESLRFFAGLLLFVITALMVLGGVCRIARAAERLIPFVSTVYILSMGCVLALYSEAILPSLKMMVTSAFSPRAALGGTIGVGVTRGIFTHEAGMGSSAIAHAAAREDDAQRQGLLGIVEVFVDTMVVCTITALGILVSGCYIPYGQEAGAELTAQALAAVFGEKGSALMLTLCLACFALSTLMVWSFYGVRCVEYITGGRGRQAYLWLFSGLVIPFSMMNTARIWEMTEVFTVLMALCNVPSVLILMRREKKLAEK